MLQLKQVYAVIFLLATILSAPLAAHAYDEDTHFYATYAMARFTGIRHEVAMKLALTTQWMDESYISDPTSMLLLPVTGVQKRRLLHFPSSREGGHLVAGIQDESFGFSEFTGLKKYVADKLIEYTGFTGQLKTLLLHTQTETNHEFASALLMQGLQEGNLLKCGASLHVIEDSYAHAGTAAEEGHTFLWHWPDRPYDDVDKYFAMTETVFKALVAIRLQLPEAALDCQVQTNPNRGPNCKLDAYDLYTAYSSDPLVRQTVGFNLLKDFSYIRVVLQSFILSAVEAGYLIPNNLPGGKDDFLSLLDRLMTEEMFFNGKMDAYKMLELYVARLLMIQQEGGPPLLDLNYMVHDMGLIGSPKKTLSEYVKNYASFTGEDPDPTGVRPLLHKMVRRVLIGYVPMPLDQEHREEIENDFAVPRKYEMETRIANMRAVVKAMFGTDIEFIGNNSKDDIGFKHEVLMEPEGNPIPIEKPVDGVVYATFSLAEKNAFDRMIFHYLFPSLTDENLITVTNAIASMKNNAIIGVSERYAEKRADIVNSDTNWFNKFWKISISYPMQLGAIVVSPLKEIDQVTVLLPFAQTFLSDTVNKNRVPTGFELDYQNPGNFETIKTSARAEGLFPQFLGPKDIWNADLIANQGQKP